MLGKQRLVGGHDRFAMLERGLDRKARGTLVAADQLDEEIDVLGRRERDGIVEELDGRCVEAAILGPVAGRDGGHDDLAAGAGLQRLVLLRQQAHDGRADRADAGDADPQNLSHVFQFPARQSGGAALCPIWPGRSRKRGVAGGQAACSVVASICETNQRFIQASTHGIGMIRQQPRKPTSPRQSISTPLPLKEKRTGPTTLRQTQSR